MRTVLKVSATLAGLIVVATLASGADAPVARDPANYVGTKSCGICHKAATGDQLGIWTASPHAKAFEILGTPEAKAVGAKVGVEDPQTSGKCLSCHSTAYHFTEEVKTAKLTPADGVSCESCHGPGKGYMAKATMMDQAKAIAGGMVHPASQSCTLCHNEKSPTWKADAYTLKDGKKVGFDYEQAYEKIKHPVVKAAK